MKYDGTIGCLIEDLRSIKDYQMSYGLTLDKIEINEEGIVFHWKEAVGPSRIVN